jgi:hypothetical protein
VAQQSRGLDCRMTSRLLPTAIMLAAASALLSGCDDQPRSQPSQIVSYASHEPGSNPAPTNEASFRLLGAEGPARLDYLRMLIVRSGKQCNSVTRATFMGGFEGTDQWRVKCADSGDWSLWFRSDGGTELSARSTSNCA